MPPHPTVPGLPAPLVAGFVDPMSVDGPWRALRKAALASGWRVKAWKARGWHHDANGRLSALADTFSLRGWRERNENGDVDRFAAVWTRPTWPTLGRVRRSDETQQAGEGRPDTSGRTWLWHPPMAAHPDVVEVSWKFDAGWTWVVGAALRPASAAEVRDWVKGDG